MLSNIMMFSFRDDRLSSVLQNYLIKLKDVFKMGYKVI
jgi:hypothetical protein